MAKLASKNNFFLGNYIGTKLCLHFKKNITIFSSFLKQRPNFPVWGQSLSENWPQSGTSPQTCHLQSLGATTILQVIKNCARKNGQNISWLVTMTMLVVMETIDQQSWTKWCAGWKPCNLYHLQITIAAAHQTLAPIGNILKLDDPSISQNVRR